jgi:hypothetical protein
MSNRKVYNIGLLILAQFVLMVAVTVFMFKVKYETFALEQDLVVLNKEITADKQALHVYKAELALLSSPESVKKYVNNYLPNKQFSYVSNRQLKDFSKLQTYLQTNQYSQLRDR